MITLSFRFENTVISDEALAELNDELNVSVEEFGTLDWGDFEGGTISRSGSGFNFSFPNSSRTFTNRDSFIALFASKVTSGSCLIHFMGSSYKEGGNTYQIIANDSNVEVYKFEYKAVLIQETPFITKSIYSTQTTPLTFDTTLDVGDNAVNNVSLAGAGTIEFDNLNSNDDPITDNKNAVIKIGANDIAQVTFTTSYIGEPFRFIHNGVNYIGEFAQTTITVIEE